MSRKSMEELLTAFDPLHFSGSGSPLFPGTSATPSTTAASASSSSSTLPASTSADTRLAHNSQHAPVSLSQAPLDLLSFEDDASNASQSVPSSSGPHARDAIISRQPLQGTLQSSDPSAVQARAARRQDDLLSELQTADQTFTVPSSGPSKQATSGTAGSPPERPGRHRRTSSGFSPPRRMSKSGLMYDENVINQLRTQHRSGSPQSPIDVSFVPPSPSTQISEEPEVIFHPSSPPAGTTIETLRNSSYFPPASNNRNATIPPPHAASHGHTIFDRPVATSDRQRRTSSSDRQAFHTLNEATSTGPHQSDNRATEQARKQQQPGSRTAFIHNALRSPLPPFASPSLKQSTSSHIPPIPGPSATRAPRDSATQTSNSAPQPSSPDNRLKNTRKATFEFPTFSSLGTSSSGASSNSKTSPLPQHRQPGGSGSNTPSPASSMIIDSDPLPSLVLKVTGAAKESKRVLTEDIADGVNILLCVSKQLLLRLTICPGSNGSTTQNQVMQDLDSPLLARCAWHFSYDIVHPCTSRSKEISGRMRVGGQRYGGRYFRSICERGFQEERVILR